MPSPGANPGRDCEPADDLSKNTTVGMTWWPARANKAVFMAGTPGRSEAHAQHAKAQCLDSVSSASLDKNPSGKKNGHNKKKYVPERHLLLGLR